jgi:hypothetical protein
MKKAQRRLSFQCGSHGVEYPFDAESTVDSCYFSAALILERGNSTHDSWRHKPRK